MLQSPFKLLEPYGPGDKDIFFGRDAEIYALYSLLQQTRLVLVYGASGTGKTSLIQAGLPKVFKLTDWFRISVRRRDDLNKALRTELARALDSQEPVQDIVVAIQEVYESRWIPLYLVFDQFEELFTLGNHEERVAFFTDLQQILDTNLPCKIILSMREEYIGHLYEYEPLAPGLFEKRFRVEPMKDETVRNVIGQMSDNYGIELENEKETPAQILEQVKEGKQAAHLPYLQIYLHYLYEHAMATLKRPKFTKAGTAAIGQLGNVLKRFIETKLADAQNYLRGEGAPDDLAQRLLDEFATDEGTKQSYKSADLARRLQTDPALVQKALLYFSDTAKLLRADEDDVERYEPVHDVVAKQIHELRSAEDKEFKAFARQVHNDYERWQAENQNTGRLMAESDLAKVDIYRERLEKRDEYRQLWKAYIEESRRYRERMRGRERRRLIAVSAIAVVAVIASVFAFIANQKAQTERLRAEGEKTKAELAQKEAEAKRNEAVNNLKLYKEEELRRKLADVDTYIKSGDKKYASSHLESAEKIRVEYFPEVVGYKMQIEELRKRIR
ncbi:MAG TPA: ATP-binding protein [Saprospiraceae bacterium]|nr:ATP-binding protein [Saprospiraceae bacterium]